MNQAETGETYSFTFVAMSDIDKMTNSEYKFTVEVPKNQPPTFTKSIVFQTVTAGTSFDWKLPSLVDPEGDDIATLNVKMGMASKWIEFDPVSMEFKFNGAKTATAGRYSI